MQKYNHKSYIDKILNDKDYDHDLIKNINLSF
jgi:hypothetical protein